ncbi:MAG: peroxide stress protein YaaA [Pseudomonadota bacterium]
MLAVISPAKKLDFTPAPTQVPATLPRMQTDANKLARVAKGLSADDLRALMDISDDLAKLNRKRFKAFKRKSDETNSKQAMLAFAGDVYAGLNAGDFEDDDVAYAQDHLRILSGLYGVLRPLDRIQPYRLEMGSRMENSAGATLYAYWGGKLAKALDKDAGGAPVVNLASQEYFRAANEKAMKSPVVAVDFKEERNDKFQVISFFAKRARGAMARFIVEQRVDRVDGLQDFDAEGYRYNAALSEPTKLTFTRAAA